MLNKIKKLVASIFGEIQLNADSARIMTRYGKLLTKEQIFSNICSSIEGDMKDKIRDGKYSISLDITLKNEEFLAEICVYFAERGFRVYKIDNTIIPDFPDRGILLITWKKKKV